MSRVIQDATACREALARLPELNLGELRQQWRILYKTEASRHLSRELLVRAVAYRMQEVALGGLPSRRQRNMITSQISLTEIPVIEAAVGYAHPYRLAHFSRLVTRLRQRAPLSLRKKFGPFRSRLPDRFRRPLRQAV